MTCIVGVSHKGKVFMGADSAGVSGWDMTIRTDRKVFKNGDFLIGFTSSFRMGQLLAVKFTPPYFRPDADPWRYMIGDFVEGVRSVFATGGYKKTENGVDTGGIFLVGFKGRIFSIQSDFQVGERTNGFDACGCGDSYALGSLTETMDVPPEDRIRRALIAASTFSAGVREPFFIESMES